MEDLSNLWDKLDAEKAAEVPEAEEENFDHDPNKFDFVRKRKAFLK